MGLFSSLFKKAEKINDPFWGEMLPVIGYFECRRHFSPKNGIIEIGLDKTLSDLEETQKAFFRSIEDGYETLCSNIAPLIEDEVRNWKPDFSIKDFKKEFIPSYLKIPACDQDPIIWEIAFDSVNDPNHTYAVTVSKMIPESVLIDG